MTTDLSGVKLRLVECLDDALELKRWLGERRPVLGVDTETAGFDWWRVPLRMVQLGDAQTGWAVPFEDWRGVLKETLSRYDRELVFHNFKFDVLFLEVHGVTVPRQLLHDTRVLVHLDDTAARTALKVAAAKHIDSGFAAGQARLEEVMQTEGWTWATIPLDYQPYWAYAALDAVMTAHLWERFKHHCGTPVYEMEIRATDVLLQMERRGVRVDLDYCERMRRQLRDYATELRRWARAAYGVRNLTADLQTAPLLEQAGWEPAVFTPTGRPAMSKAVLQWVEHPLARAILDCRHAEKMASAYLDHFVELADGDYLHPKINPLGARTGRMSITEPALQTLPRDDPVVRDAFIPREGHTLLLCDYDQIEMRLLADFAAVESMITTFRAAEVDVFTWMTRLVYNDPTITRKDPRRQRTKNAGYAKIYGAGTAKFAETAGISFEEGAAFLAAFDGQFPEINRFIQRVEATATTRHEETGEMYVTSPVGRRHRLSRGDGVYKLVNYLIQGTAADVLKQKLIELDAAGLAEYLVLPVHDELDLDVPTDLLDEVEHRVQEVMPCTDFQAPITVATDRVRRWGDKYRG